jgi:hypothetical protein
MFPYSDLIGTGFLEQGQGYAGPTDHPSLADINLDSTRRANRLDTWLHRPASQT